MGPFGATYRWGGGGRTKNPFLSKIYTYPTMIELGTVIPYLKKFQKIFKSRDTPIEFS